MLKYLQKEFENVFCPQKVEKTTYLYSELVTYIAS